MSKKIFMVLFVFAMMVVAITATQVLATEFKFEVVSRENFAGSNDLKSNANSLNASEPCDPGFGVTFLEDPATGKVGVVFSYAQDANIPKGSIPKVNANKASSVQELRLYVPCGSFDGIVTFDGVNNIKGSYTLDKKGNMTGNVVIGTKDGLKVFDSILIAGAGFSLGQEKVLNIDWAAFKLALNDVIDSGEEFFMLGHYSLGYGPGGAKSIQVGRLELAAGNSGFEVDDPIAHFASASFDKFIDGWYTSPFANSKFQFYVVCDDCQCQFGPFTSGNDGAVTVTVWDSIGAQMLGGNIFTGCNHHGDNIDGCHYTITEALAGTSPWEAITKTIGFTVWAVEDSSIGVVDFDDNTPCDDDGFFFENGAKNTIGNNKNFWVAIHFASGTGGTGGSGDTTTLTLGGQLNNNGNQGWGFTYFDASGLSLTNPIYCDIVKGGSVVENCRAILSLEVNKAGALEIVIHFENFTVSGNVHMGFFATETAAKACADGAPGQYPIKTIGVVNNTVTIPFSVFQSFVK